MSLPSPKVQKNIVSITMNEFETVKIKLVSEEAITLNEEKILNILYTDKLLKRKKILEKFCKIERITEYSLQQLLDHLILINAVKKEKSYAGGYYLNDRFFRVLYEDTQPKNMIDKLAKAITPVNRKKILIIGDVMIDNFMFGHEATHLAVERHYLDGDYMIDDQSCDEKLPGGSGCMALAFSRFFDVDLIGLIGENDCEGERLVTYFRSFESKSEKIRFHPIRVAGWPTTLKIYFYYNRHGRRESLRLNREVPFLTTNQQKYVMERLSEVIAKCLAESSPDCILIKDFQKGMINRATVAMIGDHVKKTGRDIPIFVDPKYDWETFRDIRVKAFFPNVKKAMC